MVEEQVITHTQDLAHADLQVEVVRSLERFNSLGAEWDRLVDRWGVDRVFLSHAWFRSWWEAFGGGRELHVVTVRSRGELVAAAPMMRTRSGRFGLNVDSIEAIYNHHTPRYDFIVGNNQDPRFYKAIWDKLIKDRGSEMIVLAQVPDASQTIPILEKFAKHNGWLRGQWMAPSSPFVPLGCDYATFFNSLKGGSRYNLRKRYDKLRKAGPVDIEVVSSIGAVREAMEDGLRIEAAAWKGDEGTAILCDPAVAEFYTRLAEREAELGQLRLSFLRVAGKRIAFSYLLRSRKRLYAVKIGYDPKYHAYSPGNMLLNLVLQDACAEGIEEYDFLGCDDEWKFEWTKEKRDHRWLFLFRNQVRPRLLHYLKFSVIPAVKPGLKALCTYLPGRA